MPKKLAKKTPAAKKTPVEKAVKAKTETVDSGIPARDPSRKGNSPGLDSGIPERG